MAAVVTMAALLPAVHALPATAAAAAGVTLKIYKNLGLLGAPASTSVLATPEFEHSASEPFSAEMVGTLDFPAGGGVFRFDCNWTVATMGYVWVDGHMVCQDAHTYKPGAGTTDNPLPVNTFKRSKGIVASLPFRAHYYFNGKGPPAPPPPTTCTGVSSVGIFDDHGGGMHHKCGFKEVGGPPLGQNTRESAAKACFEAGYKVAGAQGSKGEEVWCGNTATPSCPKLNTAKGVPCLGDKSETCGDAWKLEVFKWDECHADAPPPPPPGAKAGLSISWAKGATRDEANKAVAHPISSAVLTPALPAEEAQRDELQRSMTTGWGAWMHSNMLAMVKLPDNAVVTPKVCLAGSSTCISSAVPDGAKPRPGNKPGVSTRVGLHAYGELRSAPPPPPPPPPLLPRQPVPLLCDGGGLHCACGFYCTSSEVTCPVHSSMRVCFWRASQTAATCSSSSARARVSAQISAWSIPHSVRETVILSLCSRPLAARRTSVRASSWCWLVGTPGSQWVGSTAPPLR